MKLSTISITFLLFILMLTSCSSDETEPLIQPPATSDCDGLTSTYTSDIKAIMDTNCATPACHSASNQANGMDLSNYTSVRNESIRGRFLGSIKHDEGFSRMPQGGSKLSDATINIIACWIDSGSPE